MNTYHTPVLLQAVIDNFEIKDGDKYVDATIGGGGHTQAILNRGGLVLGIDQDVDAIEFIKRDVAFQPALATRRLILERSNFTHLPELIKNNGWEPLMGILVDLGVSSHQFDTPERGFSHRFRGPLDMRMDQSLPHSANTLLNSLPEKDLAHLLKEFGEIKNSKYLADLLVHNRPFTSTDQLSSLLPFPIRNQVFQSLRIAVNDELGSLESLLESSFPLLASHGKLAIISFHSLEDRIVKDTFISWEKSQLGKILFRDPITASTEEISQNPRSKSAKLRIFIKQ